jgi:hypothetical protein
VLARAHADQAAALVRGVVDRVAVLLQRDIENSRST